MMENETVAQIVAQDYRTAAVFKKFGIDFCCGGKVSLEETCQKNDVDKDVLLKALKESKNNEQQKSEVESLELDTLAEHIVHVHHSYVRKRLPEIDPFLTKVVRVHGESHPELKKVQEIFNEITGELTSHMQKEEEILFPYIKEMVSAKKNNEPLASPSFDTINNPIQMMEQEHELVGDEFKEIRKLSNNLTPPADACNTYKVTYSMLAEFEDDLHRHIHLENNILFPKAILLEKELANK